MTNYHKELNEVADGINKYDFLCYEIAIKRRNGNYCVDKYESDGSYHGAMFIGDYKEVMAFLRGMRYSFFYQKPF